MKIRMIPAAAALLLLAQIPAVINIVRYQVGSGFAVFGSVALGLILIAFGAFTVLAIQRLELKRRVKRRRVLKSASKAL